MVLLLFAFVWVPLAPAPHAGHGAQGLGDDVLGHVLQVLLLLHRVQGLNIKSN